MVVKELRALTGDELARAAERLRNPAPGSRMEAAKKYGIDLTLLISQLRLTPAERVARMSRLRRLRERSAGRPGGEDSES